MALQLQPQATHFGETKAPSLALRNKTKRGIYATVTMYYIVHTSTSKSQKQALRILQGQMQKIMHGKMIKNSKTDFESKTVKEG